MNYPDTGSTVANIVLGGLALLAPSLGAIFSGLWAWKKFRTTSNRQKEVDVMAQQNQFYSVLLKEVQELRDQNGQMIIRIGSLEQEIHQLRRKLEYYEQNPAAAQARDLLEELMNVAMLNPCWIHDMANNKWYLNDAYCERFHIERPNFWTPINIFGLYDISAVQEYMKNDLKVVESGAAIVTHELVRSRILDPNCDDLQEVKIRKVPIVIGDHPYVMGQVL